MSPRAECTRGGARMQKEIRVVDRDRGFQLSASRITVHDLDPYFQVGWSDDEIIRWIPNLTPEEIRIVERYYHQLSQATRTITVAMTPIFHRELSKDLQLTAVDPAVYDLERARFSAFATELPGAM
jgi:Protein of unknown function (DUF433)